MSVRIELSEDKLIAYLEGELDHHAAAPIRQKIDEAILEHKPKKLIIDFEALSFMDSSGIGLVMGRYRLAASKGKKLRVDNLSERDYKIMKMSGIEKLAEINKTVG